MQLRGHGLFLCSNRVTLEHPFYNSPKGRLEFEKLGGVHSTENDCLWVAQDGTVMITASIEIPEKFESFLTREDDRYNQFGDVEP